MCVVDSDLLELRVGAHWFQVRLKSGCCQRNRDRQVKVLPHINPWALGLRAGGRCGRCCCYEACASLSWVRAARCCYEACAPV